MANGEDKSEGKDFYQVLGLNKECSASDLKNAYKKLALRWHPDRCSAPGNSKFVEEAKQNFQAIQHAYSVLSDVNKRFLYDVGAYDSDDDQKGMGMGDFLNEMAVMMTQTKPNENGEETFEDLQVLFESMFQEDMESFGASFEATTTSMSMSSSYMLNYGGSSCSNRNKKSSEVRNLVESKVDDSLGFGSHFHKFCVGVEHQQNFKKGKGVRREIQGETTGKRWRSNGSRKQKVSSARNVSSGHDHSISAS